MAHILIIDDSSIIRDLLSDFLTDAGHTIETACDGAEGLEKARQGNFDLCFCDLHMPKKNGYQILCELESDRNYMRFVFTDSLPDELYDRISQTSDHLCLRKPFDLDQVREVLEQTLSRADIS